MTMINMNIETPKRRITEWTEFQENEVGTKDTWFTRTLCCICIRIIVYTPYVITSHTQEESNPQYSRNHLQ